jgi:hypothetical protein
MNYWIPTTQTLPNSTKPVDQIYVLAHVQGWKRPRLLSYYTCPKNPRWYDEEDNQFYGEVLHWMKLPELPTN